MSGNQNVHVGDSKFRQILVAARRARQVQSGAKPLVLTQSRKPTRVAQEELRAGVLPYDIITTMSTDPGPEISDAAVNE